MACKRDPETIPGADAEREAFGPPATARLVGPVVRQERSAIVECVGQPVRWTPLGVRMKTSRSRTGWVIPCPELS